MANRKIRVIGYTLVAASAVTAKFQSGGSTDLTGAMSLITGVPLSPHSDARLPAGVIGLFETNIGEKLNLVLGSGVQVSGHLAYVLVN